MSREKDQTLNYLLDLDQVRYVVDEELGLWVKFEAKKAAATIRKNGVRYSLSLHDRTNQRILGFDNAHEVKYGGKRHIAAKRTYEHWHSDEKDRGRPYIYKTAAKLIEDFWHEVDKRIDLLKGENR